MKRSTTPVTSPAKPLNSGHIKAGAVQYPAHRVDAAFAEAGLDRGRVVAFVHPDRWLTLFERLH
ncbi:hypothetical protein ABT061_02220 [Streptosporangium sp. NPDC002544]|uniref:hypothetical protein n=1 Tax=Streptosporangium sp. NPDC002544 TaxID=3154538 RepID=UPI00332F5348